MEKGESKLSYAWRIPPRWAQLGDGQNLETEPFSSGADPDIKWSIRFYRAKVFPNETAPIAFLARTRKDPAVVASWTLTWFFSPAKATKPISSSQNHHTFDSERGSGYITRQDLDGLKWPDGSLLLCLDLRFSRVSEAPPDAERATAELFPSRVARLLFSAEHSDFTVKVGGARIPAHKLVLLGHSDVLGRMLEQEGMLEANTSTLRVEDFDEDTVRAFLEFLYTGRVAGLAERSEHLLAIADKYDVAPLKALCQEHLCGLISPERLCSLAGLADACNGERLAEAYVAFASGLGALPREGWLALRRERPSAAARLAGALPRLPPSRLARRPPASGQEGKGRCWGIGKLAAHAALLILLAHNV